MKMNLSFVCGGSKVSLTYLPDLPKGTDTDNLLNDDVLLLDDKLGVDPLVLDSMAILRKGPRPHQCRAGRFLGHHVIGTHILPVRAPRGPIGKAREHRHLLPEVQNLRHLFPRGFFGGFHLEPRRAYIVAGEHWIRYAREEKR